MRKLLVTLMIVCLAVMSGCVYVPGGTDLGQVIQDKGMVNITTGDGTFENYTATGYYTGLEIGVAVGIPYMMKIMELYPKQTNEQLLGKIAQEAKDDGANAMINVTPPQESYLGLPLMIVGVYFDTTEGTGIKTK